MMIIMIFVKIKAICYNNNNNDNNYFLCVML